MSDFLNASFRSSGLLLGFVCLFVFSTSTAQAVVDWSTKHQPRIGPNLVSDPGFNGFNGNGSSDWFVTGATYDGGVSRSAGSGSMKLLNVGSKFESFFPSQVPVTPGKIYTLSAYAISNATNGLPSPTVIMTYNYRSAAGLLLGQQNHSKLWGNSKAGEWEEMTTFIEVPEQINGTPVGRLELEFFVPNAVDGVTREAWIDDVYVGQGRGFEQPPSPKTAFDGKLTRVDELGNIEVLRDGTTWEPFFPLAMYGDATRPNWSDYSDQGFNMNMWSRDKVNVKKAADAGMMSGVELAGYMIDGHSDYNDVGLLQNRIADFKSEDIMDDILLYYWDNESANEQWDVPVAITDAIKAADVDASGDRLHPIYTLNGQVGHARRHQNDLNHLSDITGTYVGGDTGDPRGRTNRFRSLDNSENQRQPAVFAQINRGVGDEMRPRLYGAIAHGARGMGTWRDSYSVPGLRVEDLPWWNDFPNIAAEIGQMLAAGLIQVQHWTEWSIDTDADHLIDFGTRDLNGEGYLIAVNYDDTSSVVTFTLDGLSNLGYMPVEVRDFFTDAFVANLTGNQFDLTLGANSSGVFRLVAPQGIAGDYNDNGVVDAADYTVWLDNLGAPAGTLLHDTDGGVIGQAQYATWKANFGNTSGSGSSLGNSIPEPNTALLMLVGVFFTAGIIRRTSCQMFSPAVDATGGGVASQQMFDRIANQGRNNQSAWRQR